ncbi:hypothetical protein AQI95_42060 [Streptomyces yokosukanensis]|uniref:Uncharacterized protein n=1 Tax=Streptomyces yokosukanensis TaxID=67386 RepID=A0A101NPU0_9ACTN|nr:hypothetical protein AQI95_42060 [Streptomyces yokosukanensis]
MRLVGHVVERGRTLIDVRGGGLRRPLAYFSADGPQATEGVVPDHVRLWVRIVSHLQAEADVKGLAVQQG